MKTLKYLFILIRIFFRIKKKYKKGEKPKTLLGKAPVKKDLRNIQFKKILKFLPKVPTSYDVDDSYTIKIPLPMYANDQYGNCVIAGRAHQTLRFELTEQKKLLKISDNQVIKEYLRESGGVDSGLYVLDSLKTWRKRGWNLERCKKYNIHAFAQVDVKNKEHIKAAIYLLNGLGIGLALPISASRQFELGLYWTYINDNSINQPNSWGGHYVYVCGYDKEGVTCITWGKKQFMTWEFFQKYCDEAYAIIDNKNKFTPKSPLNLELLDSYLNVIKS